MTLKLIGNNELLVNVNGKIRSDENINIFRYLRFQLWFLSIDYQRTVELNNLFRTHFISYIFYITQILSYIFILSFTWRN